MKDLQQEARSAGRKLWYHVVAQKEVHYGVFDVFIVYESGGIKLDG